MIGKYYIESKLRFSLFIIVLIAALIIAVSILVNGTVHGANIEKAYYVVTVESGDTLWSIAEKYMDESNDIRKYIYEISNINELSSADLSIGQQLIIPI